MLKKTNAPRNLNKNAIIKMYNDGYCIGAIARKFDCQTNAISHHLSDHAIPIINMRRTNSKLTVSIVNRIRNDFIQKKMSSPKLSKKYSVSQSTILNVVHGVFYRWVPGKVLSRSGQITIIPENFYSESIINTKGAKKPGPNPDTIRMVSPGTLILLSKKYHIDPSTVSRWIRKGKIDIKKELKNIKRIS